MSATAHAAIGPSAVITALTAQHKEHPTWAYKLHADNLVAQVALGMLVGDVPSYVTMRRTMKERGLVAWHSDCIGSTSGRS